VGDIHHSNDVVFGPALNVAHHLKSNGFYPRIIIDKDVADLSDCELIDGMRDEDEAGAYIDPYWLKFIRSDFVNKKPIPDSRFLGIPGDKAVELYTALLMSLEGLYERAGAGKPEKQLGSTSISARSPAPRGPPGRAYSVSSKRPTDSTILMISARMS
jgi:hypothetical protein